MTDEAEALFFRVREFLLQHQQPTTRKPGIVLAIMATVGIVFFASSNTFIDAAGQQKIHMTPGLAVCTVLCIASFIFALKVSSHLTLETRLNSSSFWSRNKEGFATHAITSGISGVIGYLIGHFLK